MDQSDFRIQFVTHACLKVQGTFGTLVCDPWILNEPISNFSIWKYPAAVLQPEQIVADVDYLYITHCHEDHFHVPSLACFSRDIQVLLPEYDTNPSLRAQTMERVLRELGFWNIRKLRSWETCDLGADTRLTMVPSSKSRWYEWENSGFILDHPQCTMINMNDNISDEDLCREICERTSKSFDIGFIQGLGVSMFPGCFRMSRDEMRRIANERKAARADQRRMIEFLKPRVIVPFAGDFCWLDDRYFHNNWAARSTPKLFYDFVAEEYPDGGPEVMVMAPSDEWTPRAGLVQNHPDVDWDHYLDEIQELQQRFRPKIDRINAWLGDVNLEDLAARSQEFTARIARHITKNDIRFSMRFRHVVEREHGDRLSFVLKASPEDGFSIAWDDDAPVAQTLYVPEKVWAAIIQGKLLWIDIQWVAEAEQHVDFTLDIAKFWFWIESHIGLNNKNVQAIIEPRLYPHLDKPVDPTKGVFPMACDWESPAGPSKRSAAA